MQHYLCLILLIMSSVLYANDKIDIASKPISISIATADLPPFVYPDENGRPVGLFVDMLNRVQQKTHVKIEILIMPWARALSEVRSNNIDAILPTLWSKPRTAYMMFPELPFYTFSDSVLIKRADDDFTFTNVPDIGKDKLIGKIRAVMIHTEFDRLVSAGKLKVYETPKLEEALMMLAQKKLDLVASDGAIALSTIKIIGLESRFTLFPMEENVSPSYIAFSFKFAKTHNIDQIMSLIIQHAYLNSPEFDIHP